MNLTPLEQRLVEHVERGEVMDLAGNDPIDEKAMQSWDDTRTISASVIRDIMRGELAQKPDPHGLRLHGARIRGRIDLDNISSTLVIDLRACLLDQGVTVRHAMLSILSLAWCRISHSSEPPLDATRLTADTLILNGSTLNARSPHGGILLIGAHIAGQVNCARTRLHNESGPAFNADQLTVAQNVLLGDGFEATGTGPLGVVRLVGTRIGGVLDCAGAQLHNGSGPALNADGLQITQSAFLRDKFNATGSGELGTVRLRGVHIGGQLDCSGARLHNGSGSALQADQLTVDQNLFLREGFRATGSDEIGTIYLGEARVRGQLDCSEAVLRNDSGSAMRAPGLRVEQIVLLGDRFEATGTGKGGAVDLIGAHVGRLDCSGALLRNETGPALKADQLKVDKNALLSDRFDAVGGGSHAALNLRGAAIGGALTFRPRRLDHQAGQQFRLDVEGLTYAGLPGGMSTEGWLTLLRDGTPTYSAQPYQHLAAALRAAGHDREARRVLMAQRRDQIHRRALTGRAERGWARLTGVVLGYGYQPWRALIGLLVVILAAVVLSVVLGGHGALAQTPTPAECTVVQRIGVGLDLGTPLITTGARTRCDATNSATGQALAVSGWVLRLLAWAFATLFIAGFTGAVRKT